MLYTILPINFNYIISTLAIKGQDNPYNLLNKFSVPFIKYKVTISFISNRNSDEI